MGKYSNTELFIEKARKIHGDLYDYKEVNYKNNLTPVKIYCKKCQDFFYQTPSSHLAGSGCASCNGRKFTRKKFIELFQNLYGNKYTYLEGDYKCKHYIKIHCNIHNIEFNKRIDHFLRGSECPLCFKDKNFFDFIEKAKKVHSNKYEYIKSKWVNNRTKIKIYCKEHDEWFYQMPSNHLAGKIGCKYCIPKSKGEDKIKQWLNQHNIYFEFQKKFQDCKDKQPLSFDFYLPDYNLCIEFQGAQHYVPTMQITRTKSKIKGLELFNLQRAHDKIKKDYCKKHNINFLEISYKENLEQCLNSFFN